MSKLVQLRKRAFFAQQCRCFYCGLPIWEPTVKSRLAQALGIPDDALSYLQSTAEHLIARQDGGDDSPQNVAAACLWCNRKRHAQRQNCAPDPVTYKSEVRRLVAAKQWHPAARWINRQI